MSPSTSLSRSQIPERFKKLEKMQAMLGGGLHTAKSVSPLSPWEDMNRTELIYMTC